MHADLDDGGRAALARAVAALDAGDARALADELDRHPALARDRSPDGDGYFARPFLLWYVAENPVRRGTLPTTIVACAARIVAAAQAQGAPTLPAQLDGALGLVCSGRVPRECGVQRELIDLLWRAGADLRGALLPALAHAELDAVRHLLRRGAPQTLPVAAGLGDVAAVQALVRLASDAERHLAVVAAAMLGEASALRALLAHGAPVDGFGPAGFHAHATALHQAVASGNADVVRLLVDAGAAPGVRDRVHDGRPLDWATHLGARAAAALLRAAEAPA
ncbi:MAG: ankyrin repeat domain-containing protein [Gemmatimonadales bacterium]|nr:ankyrin repeat domain-containing protein [Gemmatimonadales bacterium]